jgi:cytochrome c553
MRLWYKLVCAVRGHVPFSSIHVEPPPPRKLGDQLIGGFQMPSGVGIVGGGGGGHTISVSGPTMISPGMGYSVASLEDTYVPRGATEANLTIQANALRSQLACCARCHSMYWHTAPHLPALLDSNNVPELKELRLWKQREQYEQEQRRTNEAAGRLYKQYQMVLKLAGPQCDEPTS